VDIGALAANAEAKRKNEELRAENERLRNQVASPEVSRQKRLCFHLADDLRGLYRVRLKSFRNVMLPAATSGSW
jgi:hypothetical protein